MAPKQKRNRRRNITTSNTPVNPPAQQPLVSAQPVSSATVKTAQPARSTAADVTSPQVNVLTELTRIGIVTGIIVAVLILLYIFVK